uniref:Uncharacterized protein n=1 Tax=Ciona intestinalis TaxID=7719 RepID=F6QVP4_CIOIN
MISERLKLSSHTLLSILIRHTFISRSCQEYGIGEKHFNLFQFILHQNTLDLKPNKGLLSSWEKPRRIKTNHSKNHLSPSKLMVI